MRLEKARRINGLSAQPATLQDFCKRDLGADDATVRGVDARINYGYTSDSRDTDGSNDPEMGQ